jgi:hypothetical protein
LSIEQQHQLHTKQKDYNPHHQQCFMTGQPKRHSLGFTSFCFATSGFIILDLPSYKTGQMMPQLGAVNFEVYDLIVQHAQSQDHVIFTDRMGLSSEVSAVVGVSLHTGMEELVTKSHVLMVLQPEV